MDVVHKIDSYGAEFDRIAYKATIQYVADLVDEFQIKGGVSWTSMIPKIRVLNKEVTDHLEEQIRFYRILGEDVVFDKNFENYWPSALDISVLFHRMSDHNFGDTTMFASLTHSQLLHLIQNYEQRSSLLQDIRQIQCV